jgi:hypothetical protein
MMLRPREDSSYATAIARRILDVAANGKPRDALAAIAIPIDRIEGERAQERSAGVRKNSVG